MSKKITGVNIVCMTDKPELVAKVIESFARAGAGLVLEGVRTRLDIQELEVHDSWPDDPE
jgi:hypothetical protein